MLYSVKTSVTCGGIDHPAAGWSLKSCSMSCTLKSFALKNTAMHLITKCGSINLQAVFSKPLRSCSTSCTFKSSVLKRDSIAFGYKTCTVSPAHPMHLVGEPSATQNLRQGQQFKIPRDFSKFWNRDLLKVSHYDSNLQRMFVFNISIRVFWKNILKQFFACKHRRIRHVV